MRVALPIAAAATLGGCASPRPGANLEHHDGGQLGVRRIAVVVVHDGNVVEEGDERLTAMTALLQEALQGVGEFEVIPYDSSMRRWTVTQKELGIEAYFDRRVGEFDEKRLKALNSLFLKNIGADATFIGCLRLGTHNPAGWPNRLRSRDRGQVMLWTRILDREGQDIWETRTPVGHPGADGTMSSALGKANLQSAARNSIEVLMDWLTQLAKN